jgi:hypothetical protein
MMHTAYRNLQLMRVQKGNKKISNKEKQAH